MADLLITFLGDLVDIINEMSPYLMIGFLFAGILHVFFPREKISRFLGGDTSSSVVNASLIGIPLPLCSCGVIPTGISFYHHGASRGSTVSFLISTPQTGIDSILVTYSLLGLPFALIRPVIALVTGFFGGSVTNILERNGKPKNPIRDDSSHLSPASLSGRNKIKELFRFAFIELLNDISKYLVLGLLIAAVISVAIPDDFFRSFIGNDFLSMLVILIAAIPLYVCATASVPIAAVLMLKGLSPGAALVLLMAGPATNAATIALLNRVLGFRSLLAYLSAIIAGALVFGTVINHLLPRSWFIIEGLVSHDAAHAHGFLPEWMKMASSVILVFLILFGFIQNHFKRRRMKKNTQTDDGSKNETIWVAKKVMIKGMTCNHCKRKVEEEIKQLKGIRDVSADLSTGKLAIIGEELDLLKIKSRIEAIGYEYWGETD